MHTGVSEYLNPGHDDSFVIREYEHEDLRL